MVRLLECSDILFRVVCGVDFFVKFFISASAIWEVSCQHDKHHDSKSPYISSLPSILSLLNDLWGHVAWCSTEYLHLHIIWLTLVCLSIQVLKPKSMIFGLIFSSRMIFYSLMSLWAMFLSCKYFRACANYFIIVLQFPSENL